jgi:hypothetical protein
MSETDQPRAIRQFSRVIASLETGHSHPTPQFGTFSPECDARLRRTRRKRSFVASGDPIPLFGIHPTVTMIFPL